MDESSNSTVQKFFLKKIEVTRFIGRLFPLTTIEGQWKKWLNINREYFSRGGFITYELQLVSYELWVVILRKKIYELRVPFYELQSNFTSCKVILLVGTKITSSKLLFASCGLLFTNCKFKEIILRAESLKWKKLRVEILRW